MTRRAAICLAVTALVAAPRVATAAEPADLVLTNAVVHTVDAKRRAPRPSRSAATGSSRWARPPKCRPSWEAGRGSSTSGAAPSSPASTTRTPTSWGSASRTWTWTSWGRGATRGGRARGGSREGPQARGVGAGAGWHEGKWEAPAPGSVRGFPTHAALSAVSPDNPVVLGRADGHAVLANARRWR